MRKQGYYWVKYNGEWEIGHYRCHNVSEGISYFWTLPAIVDESWWHGDSDFDEIDERRIERNEDRTTGPPQYLSDNPYLCEP